MIHNVLFISGLQYKNTHNDCLMSNDNPIESHQDLYLFQDYQFQIHKVGIILFLILYRHRQMMSIHRRNQHLYIISFSRTFDNILSVSVWSLVLTAFADLNDRAKKVKNEKFLRRH